MTRFAVTLIVLLATLAAAPSQARAIDVTHSTAAFGVSHIWVEHVSGRIPILGGIVELPTNSLIPLRVTAVLDPSGVTTDEPDRDRRLKSPDFFDATRSKIPTIT